MRGIGSFYGIRSKNNEIVGRKMNVLSKIVIPRTNVTTMYINSELEELAREEFFRLKKVLEIKRKLHQAKEEMIEEGDIEVMCTICENPTKWDVVERCTMCDALIIPEIIKSDEDVRLEVLKTHLDDIVNITRDMDDQGFIAASVEDFIKTAELLKEKLDQKPESPEPSETEEAPHDEKMHELCFQCKKKYLEEKAKMAEQQQEEPELKEIVKPASEPQSQASKATVKSMKPLVTEPSELHGQIEPGLELGTFETEIKEITKVVRVKKEDGSVTEEKKVVRVKREVRSPAPLKSVPPPNAINQERAGRITYQPSGTSSKSNPYSGSKTVGVVTTRSLDHSFIPHITQRRVKSEVLSPPSPMSDPVARYCMSSVTLLSVDFGEYSSSMVNSYIDYDDYEALSVD